MLCRSDPDWLGKCEPGKPISGMGALTLNLVKGTRQQYTGTFVNGYPNGQISLDGLEGDGPWMPTSSRSFDYRMGCQYASNRKSAPKCEPKGKALN